MKLGVSYNLFDGEELLEGSIKSIRNSVDHVNVVYQTISNCGGTCSENLEELLHSLKEKGLIDSIIKYEPHLDKITHYNEITKRNIGLVNSLSNGCDYHMSMDSDEYYIEEEFERVKKFLDKNPDYDSSACQMKTYYKYPDCVIDPPEDYYVSLMYKVKRGSQYMFTDFPVLVDPTRRIPTTNCAILGRDVIEMHHMSYIRNDIRKKLTNSSAAGNFASRIDNLVEEFNNWEFGKPALFAGAPDVYREIKRVENIFNIH